MRKMKWAGLLAVLFLIFSLAACGGSPAASEEGAGPEAGGEESVEVMFVTEDLSLEPVTSEELFGKNRITMVNIWATYCGYCIEEMPDLEKLSHSLEEKDCGIIGMVGDIRGVDDRELIEEAKKIIEATGVTYPNVLPWDNWMDMLPVPGYPTTYFVDSEGRVIGEPAVGARGAADYEALVDEALAALEQ